MESKNFWTQLAQTLDALELMRISVQGGHAVMTCPAHPDWSPQITGDLLRTVHEKMNQHILRQHSETPQ